MSELRPTITGLVDSFTILSNNSSISKALVLIPNWLL
jgi:hypothetical protein